MKNILKLSTILSLIFMAFSASAQTAEQKALMMKALKELRAEQIIERAVKTGQKAPAFTAKNNKGEKIKLEDLYKEQPVLLIFYRGGWCPYCNLQMQAYNKALDEYKNAGVGIVAISPQNALGAAQTAKKNKINFPVLVDDGGKIMAEYKLNYTIPEYLRGLYKQFSIDLVNENSSKKWELPITATYLIDKNGKIRAHQMDVDYKLRATPLQMLHQAKMHGIAAKLQK